MRLGLFASSIGITALFFGWIAWNGYFFSDDFTWLWHGQKLLANPSAIFTARMSSFYSPVVNAFFTFLFPVFGTWAPGYYLINLAVHALVSGLGGLIAWRATRSRACAYAATSLIALAGSAFEPIVWIASNLHSIAALFIVAACVSYYAFLESGKRITALACVSATALAFLTKEIAIVTPVLLFATAVLHRKTSRARISVQHHSIVIGCIVALTAAYGYQEYLWQRAGFTVASGIWSINASALLHYPYSLMQMIAPVERILNASSAPWIVLLGILGWLALCIAGISRPLVLFGLAWMVISLLPVIFFSDPENPFLVASRYTYLARIGLVFSFTGLAMPFLRLPRTPTKTVLAICLFSLATVPHLLSLWGRLNAEYAYVYRTGRTLVSAIQSMRGYPGYTLFVARERPFDRNDAAIVGAAAVVVGIPESRIVFLGKNERKIIGEREALLSWDAETASFTLSTRQ